MAVTHLLKDVFIGFFYFNYQIAVPIDYWDCSQLEMKILTVEWQLLIF